MQEKNVPVANTTTTSAEAATNASSLGNNSTTNSSADATTDVEPVFDTPSNNAPATGPENQLPGSAVDYPLTAVTPQTSIVNPIIAATSPSPTASSSTILDEPDLQPPLMVSNPSPSNSVTSTIPLTDEENEEVKRLWNRIYDNKYILPDNREEDEKKLHKLVARFPPAIQLNDQSKAPADFIHYPQEGPVTAIEKPTYFNVGKNPGINLAVDSNNLVYFDLNSQYNDCTTIKRKDAKGNLIEGPNGELVEGGYDTIQWKDGKALGVIEGTKGKSRLGQSFPGFTPEHLKSRDAGVSASAEVSPSAQTPSLANATAQATPAIPLAAVANDPSSPASQTPSLAANVADVTVTPTTNTAAIIPTTPAIPLAAATVAVNNQTSPYQAAVNISNTNSDGIQVFEVADNANDPSQTSLLAATVADLNTPPTNKAVTTATNSSVNSDGIPGSALAEPSHTATVPKVLDVVVNENSTAPANPSNVRKVVSVLLNATSAVTSTLSSLGSSAKNFVFGSNSTTEATSPKPATTPPTSSDNKALSSNKGETVSTQSPTSTPTALDPKTQKAAEDLTHALQAKFDKSHSNPSTPDRPSNTPTDRKSSKANNNLLTH